MDWMQSVDIYCERLGPGFWAEPWNAWSNLAFLAAALIGARTARTRGTDAMGWALIVMAGLIGIGSFLFHTFADRWSELADTGPIWTFVVAYVIAISLKMSGRRAAPAPIVAAGVIVAGLLAWQATGEGAVPEAGGAPDPFNGSLQYLPAVIAMAVFALIMFWRAHPQRWWLGAAGTAFAIALSFRTLDRDICTDFPLGTHFLWHLFNGLMIGLLLQLYLRIRPRGASR